MNRRIRFIFKLRRHKPIC